MTAAAIFDTSREPHRLFVEVKLAGLNLSRHWMVQQVRFLVGEANRHRFQRDLLDSAPVDLLEQVGVTLLAAHP